MPNRVTDEQIDEYLALFNGDPFSATHALQEHIRNKRVQGFMSQAAKPRVENTNEAIISIDSLTKVYKVGKQPVYALNGVSLQIRKGELIALTGSSGSGKSTLLQLIGGLDKPTSGSVIVDNAPLHTMSDRKLSIFRNTTIGFVFQFFYLQQFLRLNRNIEVAGMPLRTPRKDRHELSKQLAGAVGLAEQQERYPRELSGGQIQRAAIARALFNNPKIILADEPTGNLDSKNSETIINLFEKIRDDFDTTIVIVTHDPNIARRADREIQLKDGAIV